MKRKTKRNDVKILTLLLMACTAFIMFAPSASARKSVQLDVVLIKTEPVPLQTGEYADLWVKLINNGTLEAEGANLTLVPEFPFHADPDEELSKYFGDVYPGEEYHAHFQIKVDENAVQGENNLKFVHTTDMDIKIEDKVPVQIRTDDAAVSVTNVSVKTGTIAPSKTEEVGITLKNLADSYLKNIDVSLDLSSSDIPLITIGSTTGKRIQKMAPGEETSVYFNIKADSDATEKAYKVPITLEYENEAGTAFTQEEYTGIIVGGQPELVANLAEIGNGVIKPGTTHEISLSLVNTGLSTAKFVSVELGSSNSYEIISPAEVYIGNMDSDDYESSTFKIYIEKGAENVELPVTISYKDTEGNPIQEEQNVTVETYSSSEISKMNLKEGGSGIYIIVVLVVIAIAGYYLYRRRKTEKANILEEE